jgi:hypothetical protein
MTPKTLSYKPLAFVTLVLAFQLLAVPLAAENKTQEFRVSDGIPDRILVSDKALTIEFTGRWSSTVEGVEFADVDKNAVVIMRGEGADSATWKALCETAQASLHKRVAIAVATPGFWAMRGGIPCFRVPPATVTINPSKS